jgi:large subunit ribosomal protein L20
MTRAKSGTIHAKKKKAVLSEAKGYMGGRHRLYRTAKDAVRKSYLHAYRDRKRKKREFRRLWITRLNAACRENEISYSQFIHGLKVKGIDLDRKTLSQMAIYDKEGFARLVEEVKAG